jgi:hypothetical protein
MLRDLDGPTIVNSFKQQLTDFTFIPQSDISDISKHLDILADISRRRSPVIRHSRLRKTESSIWLWDYFVRKALNSITTNTRGYHKLASYFKQYAHYENVLFAIDENHRDHVIHSIWVMMIAFYLSNQFTLLSNLYYPVLNIDLDKPSKSMQETTNIFCSHENALWILVFLTHDLGYPIQKTIIANDVMSDMISNFGFLTQTDFAYQFTVLHQTAIDELLNTLSTIIIWLPPGRYTLGIDPATRLDYSKTLEQFDHGIMSAYLIQRYLDFICDTMSWYRHISGYSQRDTRNAALRALIITWLSSISDHTNDNRYFDDLDNLSVLLVLSDELDEFSRYAHHRTRDTWVSVECKPTINCTKHSLDFVYKFSNRTRDDILSFFRAKISRIIDFFDLKENLIRKISIKCLNSHSKPPNNVSYYFERRFDSGDGFVKKAYGPLTYDVRGFLNKVVNID